MTLVLAHGGTAGLVAEIAIALAVLLVAGLAWQAARKEDDDENRDA